MKTMAEFLSERFSVSKPKSFTQDLEGSIIPLPGAKVSKLGSFDSTEDEDGYSPTHLVKCKKTGEHHSVYTKDGEVRIRPYGKVSKDTTDALVRHLTPGLDPLPKPQRESLEEAAKTVDIKPGVRVKSFDFPGTDNEGCYMIGKVSHSDDNHHYIDVEKAFHKGAEVFDFPKKIRASKHPHHISGKHGVVPMIDENLEESDNIVADALACRTHVNMSKKTKSSDHIKFLDMLRKKHGEEYSTQVWKMTRNMMKEDGEYVEDLVLETAQSRLTKALDKIESRNKPEDQDEKEKIRASYVARLKQEKSKYIDNNPNSIYKKDTK